MLKNNLCLLYLLLFSMQQIIISTENPSTKNITAIRAKERIVIDGLLKESIWQRPGFNRLLQQDPDQGCKPSQKSEFWVAYDDEAIYFAAKYYDTRPDSIMARLVRRDFIWGDPSDGCVLYLDSYSDKRSGYFFYVSAAGTLADGLIENDVKQPNDLSWDGVWEGVSDIDDEGWSVEMKIPYSQFGLMKEINRFGESMLNALSAADLKQICLFIHQGMKVDLHRGFLIWSVSKELLHPARIELLPYVTGKAEYINNDPGDPFNSGENYSPGFGS